MPVQGARKIRVIWPERLLFCGDHFAIESLAIFPAAGLLQEQRKIAKRDRRVGIASPIDAFLDFNCRAKQGLSLVITPPRVEITGG
jgi:hypothetical protein